MRGSPTSRNVVCAFDLVGGTPTSAGETPALPENVNYAVKSSFLLSFLEAGPEVSAKLKEANTKERKFEDMVKDAEQAAVLVLVLLY